MKMEGGDVPVPLTVDLLELDAVFDHPTRPGEEEHVGEGVP